MKILRLKNALYIAALIAAIFPGCEERSNLTSPMKPNTGSADFSVFVSIGNSLTAGYQNSALYESSQNFSFGKMIAEQVGADYVQPTINDPGVGGRIEITSLEPFSITSRPLIAGVPNNFEFPDIYNNLGIPGAVLSDLFNATSSQTAQNPSNVFFDVILRGRGTVLDQVIAKQPTIVTLWIGNNDILGYATSGGIDSFTTAETFSSLYDQLCGMLSSNGIPVVLANIPNITSIPFFTTVGSQLIKQGWSTVYGTKSDGSIVKMDLNKNFLTLKSQTELEENKGTSISNPLSNSVILDEDEIITAQNVVSAFNSIIRNVSDKYGFYLVDINSFFNVVKINGYITDGVIFTTEYLSGWLFSLDGVHPTTQGYAIISNEFIKVINKNFSAEIPLINVSTMPGSLELAKNAELNKFGLPTFIKGTFDTIFY